MLVLSKISEKEKQSIGAKNINHLFQTLKDKKEKYLK